MRSKRIFWMGSHKILIPTELKALQDMGYETFYPPYLGKERDQSAVYDWRCPPTTLPDEVVDKLSRYNFFWNDISEDIAEILNGYFDCVMVTINGDWLLSFLKAFKGKVIYRTFGEPYSLSEHLKSNGARPLIEERDDFWFVPHCIENAVREEWWLRKREKIVPYCLTDDVREFAGAWEFDAKRQAPIGLACPNISNPYYNAHFRYLKANFEERIYRYYGVQVDRFSDANVVGTLPREEQLGQFTKLSGFLYTYREPNVCYLPPIEMITIGGPVLYLPGSLLDRYLAKNDAGRVRDEEDARRAARRLIRGDRDFAQEIIESQRAVAVRYDSSYTLPIFRQAMEEILPLKGAEIAEAGTCLRTATTTSHEDRPVLLLGHFPGAYAQSGGEYISVHGIPRVMRRIVQVLTEAGQRVTVTARPEALNETWGFYASQTKRPNLLDVIDVNHVFHAEDSSSPSDITSYFRDVRQGKLHWIDGKFALPLVLAGGLVRIFSGQGATEEPKRCSLDAYSYTIVPHYYLFPEVAEVRNASLLVYLPDYMPFFFKGRGWFPEDESHQQIGRSLVQLAKYVMTNSQFTKDYLPDSPLDVDPAKIIAFPLPHLTGQSGEPIDPAVEERLEGEDFIFYPTQAHPNKRLDLLIRAWLLLRETSRHCRLVLTSGALHGGLEQAVRAADASDDVLLLPGISDATLSWLYRNARCLAFTSEMEGNFPTQIIEALELDCPIVTFDHPTIRGELGDDARILETASFADIEAFVERMQYAKRFRRAVLTKQRRLLARIKSKFSYDSYRDNVLLINRKMKGESDNVAKVADHESSVAIPAD